MKKKIVIVLIAILGGQIWAQTVTNSPAPLAPALPQAIANKADQIIVPGDVAWLKKQGYTDEQIAQMVIVKTNQIPLSPTPPDLKNAMVFVDNFLGGGKAGFPADVISIKKGALKFRFGGKDFDYSGNFSVLLTTPRQHKNPYLGFGKPKTAKLLTLGDFFKGETDGAMILQDATIWEKSDGFIDAEESGKEWILSGNYSIGN